MQLELPPDFLEFKATSTCGFVHAGTPIRTNAIRYQPDGNRKRGNVALPAKTGAPVHFSSIELEHSMIDNCSTLRVQPA